jgi:predicted RNA methylase
MYLDVNKVLEAAGGKWNKKEKGHVFESDAEEVIDQIILTGEIGTAQEAGYFPTPLPVVSRLIELAELKPGMFVLEPSAGTGNIAREVAKITTVDCVEIEKKYIDKWAAEGIARVIERGDFLTMEPLAYLGAIYDRVIMNPPFAKQADIKHVIHALEFLKSGGRLVSVMSAGVTFRNDNRAKGFREYVLLHGGMIERLDPGAFKESGTMVNAVIVTIPN